MYEGVGGKRRMAKKKMPFIRLSIVFIIIIILSILYSWGFHRESSSKSGMMDQSMGEMMGGNHLKEITIRDLIVQEEEKKTEQSEAAHSEDSNSAHHDSGGSLLQTLHRISTITIVVLMPFIIAGTIFLMIIWFDRS